MNLILASASPRRREICALLGIDTVVHPASAEPPFDPAVSAEENALITARAKAREVAALYPDALVLGADTSVILDTADGYEALGKPQDEEDAKRMLSRLQGRSHRVLTGVWACKGDREDGFVSGAAVHFAPMTNEEIADYVASKDPLDKAGSYGIQGPCLRYINGIEGDYYTVMGLPAASLWRFLQDFDA